MKKQIVALGILFILAIAAISCRKEIRIIDNAPASGANPRLRLGDEVALTAADEESITDNIEAFYEIMNVYRDEGDVAGSLSIDSVDFVIEAAYNYYAVKFDLESDALMGKVSFTEPLNEESELNLNNIGDAFWRMKDSIMAIYETINYEDKALTYFDLRVADDGEGNAVFEACFGIAKGPKVILTTVTPTSFTNDSIHAWKTWQPWPGPYFPISYEKGQCDINYSTKSIVNNSTNNTVLGAAGSLRNKGLANYYSGAYAQPMGYWVNIQSVDIGGMCSNGISSPPSQYTYLNIPGYDNTYLNGPLCGHTLNNGIWATWEFFTYSGGSWYLNDANIVFKEWLTTPMMNFYLAPIPSYISAALPQYKSLYAFDISMKHPIMPIIGAYTNPNIYGTAAMQEYYIYEIRYGNYVSTKYGAGIGIASM